MTQIAGLGMGNTNVAAGKTATEPTKEAFEQFASIMSQNAHGYFNLKADSGSSNGLSDRQSVKAGDRADAASQNYASMRSNNRQIAQADRTDTKTVDSVFAEKVQKLGEDVKDAVQETMDVSEEELTQAMELLGLTDMDLLQPQNLMQLVGQLTGSQDASALLTNDGVQQLMQDVTALFADFQQQNGITGAEFNDLLAQLSMNIDELEELAKQQLGLADELPSDAQADLLAETAVVDEVQTVQTEETAEQNGVFSSILHNPKEQVTDEAQAGQPIEQTQENDATTVQTQMPTEEAASQTTGDGTGSLMNDDSDAQKDNGFDKQMDLTGEQQSALFRGQGTSQAQPVVQAAEVPQADPMIRYETLMNQLEGLARAFASTEGTTLQMQLNPESLGRLVLTVTEKHGNVTAQITATNEQVKEALQTQMVELRSTLQAQGIKVEAVEVTVATHEFEQNLDGNASANAQMQEQGDSQAQGRSGGRRNLDQSMLQGIDGQLTEEEALAAQVMRDNGGSVDYTA